MARPSITESALLDALAGAVRGSAPADARTVMELMDCSSVGERAVRKALHRLKADGRLVTHSIIRESLDGRKIRLPAYTILPKKGKG